jgi:hypothetical protein
MRFDQYLDDAIEEVLVQTLTDEYLECLWSVWIKLHEKNGITFRDFYIGSLYGSLAFLYSSYNSKRMSELNTDDYEELRKRISAQLNEKGSNIEQFVKSKQKK